MSSPRARRATSLPTRPRPTRPNVLPVSSDPMYAPRRHSPRFMDASAAATRRARANISARECSAAATALPAGRVDDHDAPRGRAVDVNRVDARARPTDNPQARRPTEQVGRDASLAADQQGVRLGQKTIERSGSPSTTSTRAWRRSRASPSSAIGSATRTRLIPSARRWCESSSTLSGARAEPRPVPFVRPSPCDPHERSCRTGCPGHPPVRRRAARPAH